MLNDFLSLLHKVIILIPHYANYIIDLVLDTDWFNAQYQFGFISNTHKAGRSESVGRV